LEQGSTSLLADLRLTNADTAADVMRNAGFDVSTATVDISSRDSVRSVVERATALGEVTGLIHAAGVSPSHASVEAILTVDLYGTAVVLDEFGAVISPGGAGVVIASQSGHRLGALTPEQNKALAITPAEELLALPFLQPDLLVSVSDDRAVATEAKLTDAGRCTSASKIACTSAVAADPLEER
jgi:hypothetical protein